MYDRIQVLNTFELKLQAITVTINTRSYLPILVICKNSTPYFFSNKIQTKHINIIKIASSSDDLVRFAPYETKIFKLTLKLGSVDKKEEHSTIVMQHDLYGTQKEIELHFTPEGKNINKIQALDIIRTWKLSQASK